MKKLEKRFFFLNVEKTKNSGPFFHWSARWQNSRGVRVKRIHAKGCAYAFNHSFKRGSDGGAVRPPAIETREREREREYEKVERVGGEKWKSHRCHASDVTSRRWPRTNRPTTTKKGGMPDLRLRSQFAEKGMLHNRHADCVDRSTCLLWQSASLFSW